ncbi:MAG: ABC transporter ATP-binding protein [Kiritimatiellae bacterium]|nr:ABC transporter ATP-binding protein [Kiritimatiellia bacterium]
MLLEVNHLRIAFGDAVPVRDVCFSVPEHGKVAIVGESGCGKSLTALSLQKDHPDVKMAYVFQNPGESLNPVMRVGRQIAEALPKGLSKGEIRARILDLLARCKLEDPARVADSHPCELSGGQQQRAMIAMALAAEPQLLVADEPTTALDVTTQRGVLELVDELAAESGMAVLLITHNLGLVAGRSDWVNVMYAGEIVESGPVAEVLSRPRHPYTRGLLAAVPALDAPMDAPLADIPGTVPPPNAWPSGCAFHPRCPFATDRCRREAPPPRAVGSCTIRCFQGE